MLTEVENLGGPRILDVKRFGDGRGYFCETYNQARAHEAGLDAIFVQDNESLSVDAGTIRGLHYQLDPKAQGKLVRVVVGAVCDVLVDLRMGSSTFGDHAMARLDGGEGRQIWIPVGFAHGFCSLEPNTVIAYKVTDFYSAQADRSLRWDDPELGIEWPDVAESQTLSRKDAEAPTLAELVSRGEVFK